MIKTVIAIIALSALLVQANTVEELKREYPANVNTQPRGINPSVSDSTLESDTEMTRRIREELVKMDISIPAKNVAISTRAGRVTLSGNVSSSEEKTRVVQAAGLIAGFQNVSDELTVRR